MTSVVKKLEKLSCYSHRVVSQKKRILSAGTRLQILMGNSAAMASTDDADKKGIEVIDTSITESNGDSDEPFLTKLEDHFTLPASSNLVRFRARKNAARVFEDKGIQMVMEETYDSEAKKTNIAVRRLSDETIGVQFLRLLYSIVCALFTGFFFVFCLQILLFLVLELAVESGATTVNADVKVFATLGVFLAIIVFVFVFAEALVIAGHYTADMWTGHFLAKQFVFKRYSDVAVEWIFFTFFLLAPLIVMVVFLLKEAADWWSKTAITWFGCILAFFILFTFNIVYYEVTSAYNFVKNRHDNDSDKPLDVIKRAVLLRQKNKYSGKTQNTYLARSFFTDTEATEDARKSRIYEETRAVKMSLWSKITKRLPDWMFKKLTEPERLSTIDDVQDFRPFLTRGTWGLEKIFCRPTNSRYIAIVHGPGALTRAQMTSSIICSLIGSAIVIALIAGFLVWFQIPGGFVVFVVILALVFSWGTLENTRNIFKVTKDLVGLKLGFRKEVSSPDKLERAEEAQPVADQDAQEGDEEAQPDADQDAQEGDEAAEAPLGASARYWKERGTEPSEAVYLVSEYMRETEASPAFCWIMLRLEIFFFLVYPLIILLVLNWNMAILFLFCATISSIRHYINAAVVIEETGNMELVGGDTPQEKWENKSRLSTIVGSITKAKSQSLWLSILGAGGIGFLAIFLGAVGSSTENTNAETFTYLDNFYYPSQIDDMRYPTCTMSDLNGGFGENSTLADFAFMASIAYRLDENTQPALDSWFGPAGIEAINEKDYVDNFRAEEDPDDLAVFFKMFSFPQQNLAMIVIRGTSNNWDMLADTQLWSAAALMQGLRSVLPAGEIWTPIMDQLVKWINRVQSESLDKISFYTLTTKFAEKLKLDDRFSSVQVTGHSLGGGLAMITGAQAQIPAVGLSGPNALISGSSFNPPVTEDDMNKYTFNIIPRRDIVPMLDDKADQFQYIRCEAEPWDFVGCHFSKRSLCEILYTCGTGSRPAICECHIEFGYPKPVTDGDEDFDELCGLN